MGEKILKELEEFSILNLIKNCKRKKTASSHVSPDGSLPRCAVDEGQFTKAAALVDGAHVFLAYVHLCACEG